METFETELKNRNKNLQNLLKENNLDAYVITDPEDVWYFSNIAYSPEQRPFFFIAFPNKKPLFIVPKLEESHVDV
ncbi:MAG: aminopeptidase P family N-terminal domain-containing protein, partial [Staphylococcus equorum]|nr:aminopeptidase P family N-terminal domain-containing protein [Staphylococcus equorum]